MNIFDKFSYRIKIRYKLLYTFIGISIVPLLILAIAQDVLFSANAQGQFIFIIIFIAVLIISIILAILASRHFDKAIQTLHKGSEMISKGNLDWRMELTTHDELEDLAVAFNTMTNQLKSSYEGLGKKIQSMTSELNEEKNRFESILLSLGEGIIVADAENKIFIVNPSAEKILGINHAEYIGKSYYGCHKNLDDVLNLINLSKSQSVDRIVNVDNKIIQINIATVQTNTEILGIAMIMHDITEQKMLEKQKQDFISMITHDIKSPLTVIMGFSSLLLNNYKDKIDERMYEAFETMNNSANKILFLVEDFLLSNKLEAGFISMDIKSVKLQKILDDLIPTLRTQFEDKNISLNYKIEKNLPEILGDPIQIDRVFSNVINNAIKYTPQGGKIEIEGKLSTANNIKYVEISIHDTGVGIPADDINTIFDKYSRSKNTKSSKGTGLGLYISKMIVDAHHGTISVESKEGKGTIFYIRLKCK